MEYPGTHFTHPFRLIILGLFIAAFFVITPLVILYTVGYRYDWSKNRFSEGGALSIDITPQTTRAYLNNTLLNDTMPIRVKNIAAGRYHVRLTAAGFYDWEKDVEIANQQTVYIKEIQLIKKTSPVLLEAGDISRITLSATGRYLALVKPQDTSSVSVWVKDLTAAASSLLVAKNSAASPLSPTWSKHGNFLVISNTSPPLGTFIVMNAESPEQKINLATSSTEPIYKFQWADSAESNVLYSTKKKLMAFNPVTEERLSLSDNIYQDWFMEQNSLWELIPTSTNQMMVIKDALGFSVPFKTLLNATTSWGIAFAENNIIALRSFPSEIRLVSNEQEIALPVNHFVRLPFRPWWLLWSGRELWLYQLGQELQLIGRFSNELKQVAFLDNFNTLILNWNNKTAVFFPYYGIQSDLITRPIRSLAVDQTKRRLYFVDEKGLWKMDY